MHIEAVIVFGGQRQAFQKFAVILRELSPRPFDRERRHVIHALGIANRSRVMIAEQHGGAPRREALHRVDDEAWVGAVADEIAEKHVAVYGVALGVRETCFERFAIAMDVGEESDQHCERPRRVAPRFRSRSVSVRAKKRP